VTNTSLPPLVRVVARAVSLRPAGGGTYWVFHPRNGCAGVLPIWNVRFSRCEDGPVCERSDTRAREDSALTIALVGMAASRRHGFVLVTPATAR
jgi:hypothetical protein